MSDNKYKMPPEIETLKKEARVAWVKKIGLSMGHSQEHISIHIPTLGRVPWDTGFDQGYQAAIAMAEYMLLAALEQYNAGQLTPAATDAIALWNEKVGRK